MKERKLLIEQFTSGCPAGGPWDAMLFSGGGNDLVDDPMALWIKDFNGAMPPAALIHQGRFDAALALVRAGYEDLIGLRDRLSPQTHLFFHAYDFAIPDGRGICHLGPWLKPTFDLRGFPTQASAFAVTKILLQQFAAMLTALEAAQHQGDVHQRPGHADADRRVVAQRAASVQGRLQGFRFALPPEAEGDFSGEGAVGVALAGASALAMNRRSRRSPSATTSCPAICSRVVSRIVGPS